MTANTEIAARVSRRIALPPFAVAIAGGDGAPALLRSL
jgi:hypothetical protein